MAPSSKCLTCGLCNFTPRLIITSDALNERLRSDYGGAAIAAAAEVKEMLSELFKDYQGYSSEIARLQLEIRLLSSQQQHLKEYESKLRSLVSPIRKLPNEIMLIIFDLVSQNNRMREDPGSEDSPLWPDDEDGLTVKPALVLSSVCSRWRQLAISYSPIWSRISMVLTVEGIAERMASSRGFFSVVKLYIERSGTLSLRLKIDTMGQFSSSGTTHPVLSLLGQQSNRWQHLTFVGDNCLTREIFAIPDDVYDFPMLEEMKFETVYAGSSMQVLGIAPKLWSVEIDEVQYGMRMIPSWHQLSCVETPLMPKTWDICPEIASLRIHLLHTQVYQVASPPKSLRSLKSLDAIVHGRSDAGLLDNFLASFVCSSLTSLCLERDMDDLPNPPKATWSLRILDSFLTNSSCALTTFSIRGLHPSDSDLVAALRRMPSSTSLTVEDLPHRSHDHPYADQCSSQTITPAFIRSLHSFTSSALRPTFTPLLPRLRYLTLRCAGRVFDDSGFVDMIRSRCLPAYVARRMGIDPLQSLVLTFWDRTPGLFEGISEIYKPFSLLEEAGFRLIVKAGNMLVV